MERELREMFDIKEAEMTMPPTLSPELRNRIGRQRMVIGGVVAAAACALILGGFAATSAVSDDAAPVRPADDSLELRRHGEVIEYEGPDFVAGDPGPDLVAVEPGTGESRVLVHGSKIPGQIGNAAFSPDGRRLGFDIHARTSSLWVMNAELEPRRLAVEPGRWAWSPTDAQLAMMRDSTLTLIDASSGRKTDLGPTSDDDDTTAPVWSPDGARIVFGVRGGSLYSVDVGTGDRSLLVRLQGNLESIDGIEWSPDGSHVAILADQGGRDRRRLYVMNADGSDLRVLVDDFEPGGWGGWFPGDPSPETAWSPDGTRLAYATFSGPDQRELRIWTVSVDGSAPSLVASHTNDECCIDGGSPIWSPDGSQIAFATDSSQLAVNADGAGEAVEIDKLTYRSWSGGWYFCRCYG